MNGPRNGPHYAKASDESKHEKTKRSHNYKLIVDPALNKGQKKLYRIDGLIPGDPTSNVIVTDPRSRVARILSKKSKQADLLVPQFKVDEFYVGIPPPREVTFINLNDNINSDFLRNMVKDLGRIDECSVCYNPQNGKHLGIAKVVFETTRSAKNCVEKFDQTNKMGNTMTVFTDPLGKERQGYIDEKVYGIPRRQAEYQTEFIPRPEVYVQTHEGTTHTPHIPTEHAPPDQFPDEHDQEGFVHGEYNQVDYQGQDYEHEDYHHDDYQHDDYHHDEYHQEAYHHEELEYGHSHAEFRDYNHSHRDDPGYREPPMKQPSHLYRGNGYREYHESDRRRRDSRREYDNDHFSEHSRDSYANSGYSQHFRDHRDDRRRPPDWEMEDRGRPYDRSYNDHRLLENDDNRSRDRDVGYGRGRSSSRHGRDSDHYRERESLDNRQHFERDIDQTHTIEKNIPIPSLETTLDSEDAVAEDSTSDQPVPSQSDNQPSTPPAPEPEPDPGSLDLDSRIKMMLNMNKDLAGFGAPEPVTAPPEPPPPPPVIMPLEPQVPHNVTHPHATPMDTPYTGGYSVPMTPHGATPYPRHKTPGPPPHPAGGVSHYVNMAPPPPPGWQPHLPYNPQFPHEEGPPYPHHDYDQYPVDHEHYDEFEHETEMPAIDYAESFDFVLEDLIEDLKNVMNKDLCKRIVTQSAFKFFDGWWIKEENRSKTQMQKFVEEMNAADNKVSAKGDTTQSTTSADSYEPTSQSAPAALTSFSSLFDGSNIFGSGSFLGAGLPKMPSFRKKISPTRELELKREREEKERAKERGDTEEISRKEKKLVAAKRRHGSVSSGELSDSGSSSSSSSSSDSSDSESGSDGESSSSDTEPSAARKSKKVVSSSEAESSSAESASESEGESEESESEEESDKEEKTPVLPSKRKPPPKKQAPAKSKVVVSDSSDDADESDTAATTKDVVASSEKLDKSTTELTKPESPAKPKTPAKSEPVSPTKSATKRKSTAKTKEVEAEAEESDKMDTAETEVAPEPEVLPEPEVRGDPETEAAVAAIEMEESNDVETDTADEDESSVLWKQMQEEHNYSRPPTEAPLPKKPTKTKTTKQSKKQLQDITGKVRAKGNRELARLLKDIPDEKPKSVKSAELTTPTDSTPAHTKFTVRNNLEQRAILYELFNTGMDYEDLKYLRLCYEKMLSTDDASYDWCNDTHWVDHCISSIPDPILPPPNKKSRRSSHVDSDLNMKRHRTGSARTEGYYKISAYEKSKYMTNARQYAQITKAVSTAAADHKVSAQNIQREARSNQRRLATAFGDLDTGELLKFNQLKFRNKTLRFSKSTIHDWGLYACEPIPIDTMVIEYVGAILRHSVADEREKQYERTGIGSSYLFRIDSETVIDATKCGNLARFVNHSCDPNCYARVITVDGAKKIVIYSRKKIEVDEEITYDYKFPYEDEKIPCLCGAAACRGFLN